MARGLHVVWDWNGTLLDDRGAALDASNAAFTAMGVPTMTMAEYQARYFAPVRAFYSELLGRRPSDAEWERLDGTFHRSYQERLPQCRLAAGAEDLLAGWTAGGGTQSLLSLYSDALLGPLIDGFGIRRHFVRVDGRRRPSGGSKAGELVEHLARLRDEDGVAVDPQRVVVIGDAADDGAAARAAGVRAVLHTGGSQGRASLERAGFPVVDTLADAIALAAGR